MDIYTQLSFSLSLSPICSSHILSQPNTHLHLCTISYPAILDTFSHFCSQNTFTRLNTQQTPLALTLKYIYAHFSRIYSFIATQTHTFTHLFDDTGHTLLFYIPHPYPLSLFVKVFLKRAKGTFDLTLASFKGASKIRDDLFVLVRFLIFLNLAFSSFDFSCLSPLLQKNLIHSDLIDRKKQTME